MHIYVWICLTKNWNLYIELNMNGRNNEQNVITWYELTEHEWS